MTPKYGDKLVKFTGAKARSILELMLNDQEAYGATKASIAEACDTSAVYAGKVVEQLRDAGYLNLDEAGQIRWVYKGQLRALLASSPEAAPKKKAPGRLELSDATLSYLREMFLRDLEAVADDPVGVLGDEPKERFIRFREVEAVAADLGIDLWRYWTSGLPEEHYDGASEAELKRLHEMFDCLARLEPRVALFMQFLGEYGLSEDTESAFESLQELVQAHEIPIRAIKNWEELTAAILERDRLQRAGPLVEDINAHVKRIIAALDAGQPDHARDLMRQFHGSIASGGPQPDHEHAVMLVESLRRPEWDQE